MLTEEMLLLDRNTQALLGTYADEVVVMYDRAVSEGMIDRSASQAANHVNDFVYTRSDLRHDAVRGILYSKYGQKYLGPLLENRQVSSAGFVRVLQLIVVLFILSVLLCPAALIILQDLSKGSSFGLVVGFAVFFSLSLALIGSSFELLLVGTCGYAAILLATLVQTQVVAGPSCP